MEVALKETPVEAFKQPKNIISVRIDKSTGKLTRDTDSSSTFEYYDIGTEPTEYVSQDLSTEVLDGLNNEVAVEQDEADIF